MGRVGLGLGGVVARAGWGCGAGRVGAMRRRGWWLVGRRRGGGRVKGGGFFLWSSSKHSRKAMDTI